MASINVRVLKEIADVMKPIAVANGMSASRFVNASVLFAGELGECRKRDELPAPRDWKYFEIAVSSHAREVFDRTCATDAVTLALSKIAPQHLTGE